MGGAEEFLHVAQLSAMELPEVIGDVRHNAERRNERADLARAHATARPSGPPLTA